MRLVLHQNALTGDLGDRVYLTEPRATLDGIEITTEPVAAGQNTRSVGCTRNYKSQIHPTDPRYRLDRTTRYSTRWSTQVRPRLFRWIRKLNPGKAPPNSRHNLMRSSSAYWFNLGGNRKLYVFPEAQWEGKGHTVGMSGTPCQFTNTVVNQISDNCLITL